MSKIEELQKKCFFDGISTSAKAYLCSPLGSTTKEGIYENMLKAQEYMLTAREKLNINAIAPHAFLPIILDDRIPSERNLGLDFGIKLLQSCSLIIVCGHILSQGMIREIFIGADLGCPIWTFNEDMEKKVKNIIPDKAYLVKKIECNELG